MKTPPLFKNLSAAAVLTLLTAHSASAADTLNAVSATTATALPEHSTLVGAILVVGGLLWSCRENFVAAWRMSAPATQD